MPDPVLNTAVVALAKLVGFVLVVVCTITVFYAAIHTININSQLDVFFAGLVALLLGIVAGPLFCLIGAYGLHHYLAFTTLGSALLVIPVFLAWCFMVYNLLAGAVRG